MNHIKNIVAQIITHSTPEQSWKTNIMQNWSTIVGTLATKIFIEKISKDTITLSVTDSCWMQELHLLSDLIKQKINTHIGSNHIEHIRLKYSAQKQQLIRKKNICPPVVQQPKDLTHQEIKALDQIKDPELSQALMRFLQKCHHSY